MFKSTTVVGIALASAFTVSGAWAHDSYGHSHYAHPVNTTSYTNTYTAPTIDLGPIEYVQPNSTVQYVQPATTSYIQPATTATYSSSTYTTPSYAPVNSVAQPSYTYSAPSYGSTNTASQIIFGSTYTSPNYVAPAYTTTAAPSYTAPAYVAPLFDATERVHARMDRLRSRIRNAVSRGDLRDGERSKLRQKMRKIRRSIQAHKADDGIIDRAEFAKLNKRMSRQSDRIRRLANNDRVVGRLVSPYGQYNSRF